VQNGHGCGYVEWHDDPLPKFWSDLIGDLRDVVWRMRAEQVPPRTEEDEGRDAKIQALEEELKDKKAEIGILKAKFDNLVMIFLVFVVGLVAGKLCFQ
jgi:predicted RNase H-like nuclease (RuvC/YqgF family)